MKSYSSIYVPPGAQGVHGAFRDEEEWKAAVSEQQLWIRQHILVSAASLLEVYFNAVTHTALTAKPELLDRSLIGVDGFKYVVNPSCGPAGWAKHVEDHAGGFVYGPWKARLRRMGATFGVLPQLLSDSEGALQKLQTKRNRIVHEFGTDGGRRAPWDALERIPASSVECQATIKLVSAIIKTVDEFLAPTIGAHEVLREYHLWASKQKELRRMRVSGQVYAAFNDHIGRMYGRPLGTSYVKSMFAYYERLA